MDKEIIIAAFSLIIGGVITACVQLIIGKYIDRFKKTREELLNAYLQLRFYHSLEELIISKINLEIVYTASTELGRKRKLRKYIKEKSFSSNEDYPLLISGNRLINRINQLKKEFH